MLRGVAQPVRLLAIDLGPSDPHTVTDPVCHMNCAGRCVADPELYSKPSA